MGVTVTAIFPKELSAKKSGKCNLLWNYNSSSKEEPGGIPSPISISHFFLSHPLRQMNSKVWRDLLCYSHGGLDGLSFPEAQEGDSL